jgi:DNA-binding winged helix-turn-helix (wHTH) protein
MIYRFENFELDLDLFELRQDGAAVEIQPQVFTLISLLVTNRERMISKDEMLERIWDGVCIRSCDQQPREDGATGAAGRR